MRNPRWLVVGLVVVLGVPRLLAGPGMMADDWVWVRNGEFLGWWDAGGTRQVGRPGAYGLYALVFGLGGDRPLLHGLVQVCLWACAGLAVHWALGRLVDAQAALVCTAIWLLAPSHLTLEVWASTSQSWVAVIALACGLGSLCDERVMVRRLGWLLLAVSGAFYEVALPVVPIAAAVAGRARTGRWQLRTGAWGAAAALPAAAWSIAAASVYADGLRTTEDRWV